MLKNLIPILGWLPHYRKADIPGDLSAGLTVGVMLIPQGMAYALLADLPPIYGLYASLAPLLLYAIFGTSRQLAVGPVAMVSLMIAAGVSQFAEPGSGQYIALVILLAFMSGVVQLSMGLLRLGFLVNFLSHPVITGFTGQRRSSSVSANCSICSGYRSPAPIKSMKFSTLPFAILRR